MIIIVIGADDPRRHVVPFSHVLRHTIRQETDEPRLISFSLIGANDADYNIKFDSETQARYFVILKVGNEVFCKKKRFFPIKLLYRVFDH